VWECGNLTLQLEQAAVVVAEVVQVVEVLQMELEPEA